MPQNHPPLPELAITAPEGDDDQLGDSPRSASTVYSSNSIPDHRRHHEHSHTLSSLQAPPNALSVDATSESSRSRSSSFAGSMLSGETANTDTPFLPSNDMSKKDASMIPGDRDDDSEDSLKPDPGSEATFEVDNNSFAFSPGQLGKLFNPKSHRAFLALGGLAGLQKGLRTNVQSGLSVDEGALAGTVSFEKATAAPHEDDQEAHKTVDGSRSSSDLGVPKDAAATYVDRKRVFGTNVLPTKSAKSIWRLMWEQYNDKILILLTVAAVISLALGLYETFGTEAHVDEFGKEEPKVNWIEGVAICVAILIVVLVGSLNDWQKERQFVKLNAKKDDRIVRAIRSGKTIELSIHDILVGDVLHIEPGDMIPADGIFISGHNVKCDESSATGESDQMKKTAGEEAYRQLRHGYNEKIDPFIISGAKVLEGTGTYLVTATGVNSSFGKLMVALHTEVEATPLQVKLGKLADNIAYLGGGAALLLFAVLFFRFCASLPNHTGNAAEKGSEFMDILIVAITLVVVAIPEGLPLAVTLALAFATTRMLKDNNLVRVLRACETMGNATTVCSDKTGTLTQNEMTVVAGIISTDAEFDAVIETTEPPQKVITNLSAPVRKLLLESIVINTTAFEGEQDGKKTFIGSKTETAMLTFARSFLGLGMLQPERDAMNVVQMIPFDSARKCMGVVVKLDNGVYRLYVKGASEIMLEKSSRRVADVYGDELADVELTESHRRQLENTINSYAERSLRTIATLYKDYQHWPPVGSQREEDDPTQVVFDSIFEDMIFLSIVGIQDPLRPNVTEAVNQCKQAGVVVRMVTGDNLVTARAIARECGILVNSDDIVMEGPKFRQLSDFEMDEVIPKLRVLARSSPEDKRILVARLKHLGETVAVTGDGTNDGPALKTADIGFSMGIAGTEVAKEASSIILMDDNFASIIKALMWGRAVNDAVQKFLQFQLTVNITAVLLTFVSAVADPNMSSVLTAVQLLWVNLIMDTFAALALATDAPTPEILNRKPAPKSAPLITVNMWKMIIGQAIFQVVVTFIMHFAGKAIFPGWTPIERKTVIFNTFVWMQIFNEFNNRRLDNKFNIFQGIQHNYFFIIINCIMVGGQILIVFVGSTAFGIKDGGINGEQWAVCVVVASFSLPWAVLIRCIPDEVALNFWRFLVKVFGPTVNKILSVFRSFGRLFKKQKNDVDVESQSLSDMEQSGERKGKKVAASP